MAAPYARLYSPVSAMIEKHTVLLRNILIQMGGVLQYVSLLGLRMRGYMAGFLAALTALNGNGELN